MRLKIHSPKISKNIVLCIYCIMSKSSTCVTMKVLKWDDKVKAINICDGGERCLALAEEMGDGCT
jgi:hypothetical protein